MRNILAAFMVAMLSLVLGQSANALTGLQNASKLHGVVAAELLVLTHDHKGREVILDSWYDELDHSPTSEQDLGDQIEQIFGGSHSQSNYDGPVYIYLWLYDDDGDVSYESSRSFMPERVKRQVKRNKYKWIYQAPWYAGELDFQPGSGYGYEYPYEKPVKKIKPWNVDISFTWISVYGIEQAYPDSRGFTDIQWELRPEDGYNPAVEIVVPESGWFKLYATSRSGFVPVGIKVSTYGGPMLLETSYSDDVLLDDNDKTGSARRTFVPGELLVIEFKFGQRPTTATGSTGGGKG